MEYPLWRKIRAGVTDGPDQVPREGIYDNRLRADFVTYPFGKAGL